MTRFEKLKRISCPLKSYRVQGVDRPFLPFISFGMPVLLNLANHGGSWLENGVSYERVVGRVGPQIQEGCPTLWDYIEKQLKDAHKNGWFGIPVA